MRRIEWRRLPGAFAKLRKLQVQKSKDLIYPIGFFVITMGFDVKEDAESTPKPSMVGISTLTISQKLETIQLRPSQKSLAHLTGGQNSKRYQDTLILNKYDRCGRIPALAREHCWWRKTKSQAAQVCSRAMKFLRFCFEDNSDDADGRLYLVSANLICQFLDAMENVWKLGLSGRLSYLNALHDLMDFRKFSRPPGNVLCDFAITGIYIKRAKHPVSSNMRVQWIKDHDVDSLEGKRN